MKKEIKQITKYINFIYLGRGVAYGLIGTGLTILGLGIYPIISSEIGYLLSQPNIATQTPPIEVTPSQSFGELLKIPPPLALEPINTTNSIIIEKINVNVPIVWDVSTLNETQYMNALKIGVAHAKGTPRPANEKGNTYLFAHSTVNPLEIQKYAATFTLLHYLEVKDKIVIFNEGNRFDYLVQSKEVVKGFNTNPLKQKPDYPMLTLQTCDPPGIPLNRLIVTAKLIAEYKDIQNP